MLGHNSIISCSTLQPNIAPIFQAAEKGVTAFSKGGSSPPFEEEPPEGLDFEDLTLREVEADLDLFPPLPPVEDSLSVTEKE